MTGEQLLGIRTHLGMSQGEFVRALGMAKDAHPIARLNAKSKLRKLEMPDATVPPDIAEKATDLWLRRGGCGS